MTQIIKNLHTRALSCNVQEKTPSLEYVCKTIIKNKYTSLCNHILKLNFTNMEEKRQKSDFG